MKESWLAGQLNTYIFTIISISAVQCSAASCRAEGSKVVQCKDLQCDTQSVLLLGAKVINTKLGSVLFMKK